MYRIFFAIYILLCMPEEIVAQTPVPKLRDNVMLRLENENNPDKIAIGRFILDNIIFHYSYDGNNINRYCSAIESINKEYNYPECISKFCAELSGLEDPMRDVVRIPDTEYFNDTTIIELIDETYNTWKNGMWAGHLSVEDVCEFLLPYKVGEEKPVNLKKELRKRFFPKSEIFLHSDDQIHQAYFATCRINDKLKKLKFHNKSIPKSRSIELPINALYNIKMGECYDYAKFTAYVMRSCGIPVAVDFTPQWPDRSGKHHWNVLFANSGKRLPFMGCESNPGSQEKYGRKMAKVYRMTYAYQHNSLFEKNNVYKEYLPATLASPFYIDVSDEYFVGKNVNLNIPVNQCEKHFIYLSVFDNHKWIPVDYAETINGKASFNKMGTDIVYMPVYWSKSGTVPTGSPFILLPDGTMKTLNANHKILQTMTLNRKYPQTNRSARFRDLIKGGKFEVANTADFKDAVCVHKIKSVKWSGYDTVNISTDKKYRYCRYVSPNGGKCNIAEIAFYNDNGKINVHNAIVKGGSLDNTKPSNAFDGNELTYYISSTAENGWVGADFGIPVNINEIRWISRNDDNDIVPGQTYELNYFENGYEKTAGIKKAVSSSITFTNVPTGTLYILHNLDKGTEERIFTYDKGKIVWY